MFNPRFYCAHFMIASLNSIIHYPVFTSTGTEVIMKTLSLIDLEKIDKIATPELLQEIRTDSPAMNIFYRFLSK